MEDEAQFHQRTDEEAENSGILCVSPGPPYIRSKAQPWNHSNPIMKEIPSEIQPGRTATCVDQCLYLGAT
ncbi:hypothetical protein RRG08_033555 [Elysia crispata]|uniref:Uncharacterized protein n=1 Tax=Elysia crispata TaxID=231223 RepID=A0AAE0XPF5_9GAST|nr:hypothetical protein RRG08_033555 [Elysia crispata]